MELLVPVILLVLLNLIAVINVECCIISFLVFPVIIVCCYIWFAKKYSRYLLLKSNHLCTFLIKLKRKMMLFNKIWKSILSPLFQDEHLLGTFYYLWSIYCVYFWIYIAVNGATTTREFHFCSIYIYDCVLLLQSKYSCKQDFIMAIIKNDTN